MVGSEEAGMVLNAHAHIVIDCYGKDQKINKRIRLSKHDRNAIQTLAAEETGIIRCDQPRVLDLSARGVQKNEVLAKIRTIFDYGEHFILG